MQSISPLVTKKFVERQDTPIGRSVNAAILGSSFGFMYGTLRSIWRGPPHLETHTQLTVKNAALTILKPTLIFCAAATSFSLVDEEIKAYRQKDDWKNKFASGATMGLVGTLAKANIKSSLIMAVSLGTCAAAIQLFGGHPFVPYDQERDKLRRSYAPAPAEEKSA